MTEVLWHTANVEHEAAQELARRYQIPVRVAKWLCNRGVTSPEQVCQWQSGQGGPPMDPCVFHGITKAVSRLSQAVANREPICIVGDYDVDGVTASAILASTFEFLSAKWHCIIPHRIEDGYGLSVSLVERVRQLPCSLIVTVDNGIQTFDAIEYAVDAGIDVIVTDHHEPAEQLPTKALSVVHWREASSEQAAILSGAGVARMLALALVESVVSGGSASNTIPPHVVEDSLGEVAAAREGHLASETADSHGTFRNGGNLQELTEWIEGLAALGALADVMPMQGENHRLVKSGLQGLQKCQKPGWRALCETAGCSPHTLSEQALLWNIAPRVNAAGRMGSAKVAFDLLMAQDMLTARQAADHIEMLNQERKSETERATEEAVAQCRERYPDSPPAALVAYGNWHPGVVGIVAARLVSEFSRPSVVFAMDETEAMRGSGRATPGFDLHEAVSRCQAHLEHFGGHEAAIGCMVRIECVKKFAQALAEVAEELAIQKDRSPLPVADDYLPLNEASLQTLDWMKRFAPFGPGNEEFVFYLGPLEVIDVVSLSRGRHVKLRVRESKTEADLIWFQAPAEALQWRRGDRVAALAVLEENVWQGVHRVQLRVKTASRLHSHLSRETFGKWYRLLKTHGSIPVSRLESLSKDLDASHRDVVFETFVELGFAELKESAYHVVEQAVPRDLRDSLSYQKHLRQVTGFVS